MITLEILILILTDLDVMGKITSSILMLGALATEIGLIISINQKGKIITKEKNKKC